MGVQLNLKKIPVDRSLPKPPVQPQRPIPADSTSPRRQVNLILPLPPSVNRLYQRTRKGMLALTKEAMAFQEAAKRIVTDQLSSIDLPLDPELVYRLDIRLYFPLLENPGWFKIQKGERQAKTRYKRIDVDNRIKFLQDTVTKLVGIPDDSQIFAGSQEKHEDPDNPRVEIIVSVDNRYRYFIPEEVE